MVAATKSKTFKECAESYIEAHSADYTSDKHRKQWPATLEAYAYPIIGNMLVADIAMRHMLDVLGQSTKSRDGSHGKLWYTKTETAKRLLGRIKTILDYAIVNEYREGTNPAIWKGYLDTQLPAPRKVTPQKHHPAIPYPQIGVFMALLRQNASISAKALEFLILTAVRSGSVRLADWSEIDFGNKLWVIPPEHTKIRQEHRVPLQPQAVALLRSLPRIVGNTKIFPSPRGSHLSDMALSQLMRGMRERGELTVDAVPHGFRSTFRDWAADQTSYTDEIRKVASGHTVGDAVKRAYQRTDLLEKRRGLMTEWANFLDQGKSSPTGAISHLRG
jgi:integrase